MTTSSTKPTTKPPSSRGRLVALTVAAGVTAVLSLGFLGTGGALLWADGEADADGYVSTSDKHVSTGGYALKSERVPLDLEGAGRLVDGVVDGSVKFEADLGRGEPVFVGIAPSRDVERYLDGVAHSTVTDFEDDPVRTEYRDAPGDARPAPPAEQSFWAATKAGTGEQTLTWDVRGGDWSVVVMNAEGRRGVDADVSAGVRVAFLGTLGWSLLGGGMVLLLGAAGVAYAGLRRR